MPPECPPGALVFVHRVPSEENRERLKTEMKAGGGGARVQFKRWLGDMCVITEKEREVKGRNTSATKG